MSYKRILFIYMYQGMNAEKLQANRGETERKLDFQRNHFCFFGSQRDSPYQRIDPKAQILFYMALSLFSFDHRNSE